MCEIQDVRELLTKLWSIVNRMVGDMDELHGSDSDIESAKDMLWRARTITDKLYERDVVFWLFSNLPVKESEPLLNEDLIRVVCEYCNCFA